MYHASLSQDKTLAHINFFPEKDDKIQLVLWSLEFACWKNFFTTERCDFQDSATRNRHFNPCCCSLNHQPTATIPTPAAAATAIPAATLSATSLNA